MDQPAPAPGQIWRSDSANKFYLIAKTDPPCPYVYTHEVQLSENGQWVPTPDQTTDYTRVDWLTQYAYVCDRVDLWLHDGPRLLSVDPNRCLDRYFYWTGRGSRDR
jgi:hypothetical protein